MNHTKGKANLQEICEHAIENKHLLKLVYNLEVGHIQAAIKSDQCISSNNFEPVGGKYCVRRLEGSVNMCSGRRM